jgi:hypothetical protein
MKWGVQSGNWALCREEKNDIYLFKCTKTQKLRGIQNVLNSEWLNVNVDIAYEQLINCAENIEVRHLG